MKPLNVNAIILLVHGSRACLRRVMDALKRLLSTRKARVPLSLQGRRFIAESD